MNTITFVSGSALKQNYYIQTSKIFPQMVMQYLNKGNNGKSNTYFNKPNHVWFSFGLCDPFYLFFMFLLNFL